MSSVSRRRAAAACAAALAVTIARPTAGQANEPRSANEIPPSAPFEWQLPPGYRAPVVPADNPMTIAKVELGRALFSDPRWSLSGRHSCATCHDPKRAFTEPRARSIGAAGGELKRNAPSLINVAYQAALGWDDAQPRTLEAQMMTPLFATHPIELGVAGREREVELLWSADAATSAAFRAAFPQDIAPVRIANAVLAIAAFERTLIARGSRFDAYVFAGDHSALNATEKAGMALFFSETIGCAKCHGGLNFSGPWIDSTQPSAAPAFASNGMRAQPVRVPSLRNVAVTSPYMRDGSLPSIAAVLAHYETAAGLIHVDARLRRRRLRADEVAAVAAFLETLTDAPFAAAVSDQRAHD